MDMRDAANRVAKKLSENPRASLDFGDILGLLFQLLPQLLQLCGERNEPAQLRRKAKRAAKRGRRNLAWNIIRGRIRRAYRAEHGKKLKKDQADIFTRAVVESTAEASVVELEELYQEMI